MENFYYNIPTKIHFGKDACSYIGKEAKLFGKKALLIYGGGSVRKIGAYDDVMKSLDAAGVEHLDFSGIKPNPDINKVNEAVRLCKKEHVDMLIPIGGGSTIDSAKAIAAGVFYDGDVWDLVLEHSRITECLPILAVPTLAATGSEMDFDGLICNPDTGEKIQICSEKMIPQYAYMNPIYTYSVPAAMTAAGTADILSHLFEVYFIRTDGAYLQQRMIEAVMKTCFHYGTVALKEPNNYEARANLLWAASWGCNGMFWNGKIAKRSAAHPMEHQLSGRYDTTHGAGLSVLIPHLMHYTLNEKTVDMYVEYGIHVLGIDSHLDRYEIANLSIDKTREYFLSWGLPETLRDMGIPDTSEFEKLSERAVGKNGFIDAYIPLYKEDVMNIYMRAFYGA